MKKILLTILSIIIVLCSTFIAFADGGSISAGEGVPAGSRFSPNAVSPGCYRFMVCDSTGNPLLTKDVYKFEKQNVTVTNGENNYYPWTDARTINTSGYDWFYYEEGYSAYGNQLLEGVSFSASNPADFSAWSVVGTNCSAAFLKEMEAIGAFDLAPVQATTADPTIPLTYNEAGQKFETWLRTGITSKPFVLCLTLTWATPGSNIVSPTGTVTPTITPPPPSTGYSTVSSKDIVYIILIAIATFFLHRVFQYDIIKIWKNIWTIKYYL